MSGKTKVFLLFLACLLTMCTRYTNQIIYTNELDCQDYTEYRFFESSGGNFNFYTREVGRACAYACPDGTVKEVKLTSANSSLATSSKEELNAELCGEVVPSPTAMESLLTEFPISTSSPTLAATRTAQVSPTAASTLSTQIPAATIAAGGSLLAGTVSMCDLGGKLINFRIAQPPRDITGMTLEVLIEGQESFCYINRTNPALLTCTIPVGVSFPANIVVSLNGTVVDDFVYSGLGCAVLTTPTPAPRTPRPLTPQSTTYP